MKGKDTIHKDHFEKMVQTQRENQEREIHDSSQESGGIWMNNTVWWVLGILVIIAIFLIIWLWN